ncbi:hypothetical protein B0H14DRAFT_3425693 [Mycena olivaceomarginata]|nr:hypothetical protein B0H14DRAFT_3425693 [Mycena olivaceomarginata]
MPLPVDPRDSTMTSDASSHARCNRSNVPSAASASALHHWRPLLIHVLLYVFDPYASNLADAECGRPRSSDSLSAARGWVPRDGSDMARALPFCVMSEE